MVLSRNTHSSHKIKSKQKEEITCISQDREGDRLSSGWAPGRASRVAIEVLFLDLGNGLRSVTHFVWFCVLYLCGFFLIVKK